MLLGIDIGNTTIAVGLLNGLRVVSVWHIETVQPANVLKKKLTDLAHSLQKRYPSTPIAICSVVPKATRVVEPIFKRTFKSKVFVIGRDIIVPIPNRYRIPKHVGQDRLVCTYAAKKLYGTPAIVIDLGTAITLDVVSEKGEYLGGSIVPGIRLSAESLFKKTAMLPKIKIKSPKSIIGRDTKESILSGIFFGFGALCRGMITMISKQFKRQPHVILTGGHALLMRKFISPKLAVEKDLVFKGISLVFSSRK